MTVAGVGKVLGFDMYLATVTCYRDFPQLLLQAESIQKFVEPCRHVIIVNQDNPDIDFYYRWLKPYYTKHELVIIPKLDYFYPIKGLQHNLKILGSALEWRIQQLQKLLLAYEFDDDYILLDSKNFFVKPTELMIWKFIYGSGLKHSTSTAFGSDVYRRLLNVTDDTILAPGTPFKIDRELLTNRCKKSELGYFLFAPEFEGFSASEFIFYSVLINDKLKEFNDLSFLGVCDVLWESDIDDLSNKLNRITDSSVCISGFHRNLLGKVDATQLAIINSWLKFGLGFDNSINAIPLDPEMSGHNYKNKY